MRRIAVVIHEFGEHAVRPVAPARERRQIQVKLAPAPQRGQLGMGRHQAEDGSWLGLAERVLHSWPITLRLAVLVLVLVTGTAALAAAVGVAGQLLLAVLGYRAHRQHRRRLRDMQAKVDALTDPAEV